MRFKNIIGQDNLKNRLIESVRENRVAHAQLFFGGMGHGKLPLALAYAQFINCRDEEKLDKGDSCGTCSSCIKYEKLIHPDLHFVFPVAATKHVKEKPVSRLFMEQWRELLAENQYFVSLSDWYEKLDIERKQAGINVEECNQIIRTLNYTSYESEYKVMVIWMLEKLNYQAAPKLLKILEEPPEKTLFLLIAEQPDQIISTIRSRLLMIKVPKIDERILDTACRKQLDLDPAQAKALTRLANGSFKQAMYLVRQVGARQKIFEKFRDWMRMCYSLDVKAIMNFSEEVGRESRETNKSFLQFGLTVLRNCLAMNYTDGETVRVVETEKDFVMKFSPFIHQDNAQLFSEEFNKAIYHIERNAQASLLFLDLSLTVAKLVKMKPKQTVA